MPDNLAFRYDLLAQYAHTDRVYGEKHSITWGRSANSFVPHWYGRCCRSATQRPSSCSVLRLKLLHKVLDIECCEWQFRCCHPGHLCFRPLFGDLLYHSSSRLHKPKTSHRQPHAPSSLRCGRPTVEPIYIRSC